MTLHMQLAVYIYVESHTTQPLSGIHTAPAPLRDSTGLSSPYWSLFALLSFLTHLSYITGLSSRYWVLLQYWSLFTLLGSVTLLVSLTVLVSLTPLVSLTILGSLTLLVSLQETMGASERLSGNLAATEAVAARLPRGSLRLSKRPVISESFRETLWYSSSLREPLW